MGFALWSEFDLSHPTNARIIRPLREQAKYLAWVAGIGQTKVSADFLLPPMKASKRWEK